MNACRSLIRLGNKNELIYFLNLAKEWELKSGKTFYFDDSSTIDNLTDISLKDKIDLDEKNNKKLINLIKKISLSDYYPEDRTPHPLADKLVLPDGKSAPDCLKVWASFDKNYPWYLSIRRSNQEIADNNGNVYAKPMEKLLYEVCIEDIQDELDFEGDEKETLEYLKELVEKFSKEFPGYGVYLEPNEHPDRLLWFGPGDHATILWYEDDDFSEKKWVIGLFK